MKSPLAAAWADLSAVALSGLCLLHCLALPLLAALLPVLGSWTESEWVHGLFVLLAVPLSLAALSRAHRRRRLPGRLWLAAGLGLAALGAGAAGWPHASWETPITVGGSLLLAGTHLWNLRRGHAH